MKSLTNSEIILFCSQLAMILRSGISAVEGISILKEDVSEKEGKELLEQLYDRMEYSGILHQSMRETNVFPEYVCNMIEIGEQAGRLDEVMEGLAAHYEKEEELSSGIKSALLYPLIMLGMMAAVILVLMIKVMPVFQRVFESLGGGLTGVAKSILHLGTMINRYSVVFIAVFLLFGAAAGYFGLHPTGREQLKRFLEGFCFTKEICRKMACARVANGMYLCLKSGLDLDQSLEMVTQLVTHREVKQCLNECRRQVAMGERFDLAIINGGVFTGLYGRMISVGIRAGAVDQVMEKIANQYEEEVTEKLQSAVSMIEPTLVAILSGIVGLILLSVVLPLMGVMSNLG